MGAKLVNLDPSSSYHNQNYSDYRSASFIPTCNPEYVIQICNLTDFGHDWIKKDQNLRGTIFYTTHSALVTIVNISDEPGSISFFSDFYSYFIMLGDLIYLFWVTDFIFAVKKIESL